MKIAMGCDPNAEAFKQEMIEYVKSLGHEVTDFGSEDTIYAHRRDELFKGRRTVAVSTRAKAGSGELEYYRIRQGDTLGGIARRYGHTLEDQPTFERQRFHHQRII